ncbi:hypothetical protein MauCBS54593_001094 [Microsporum audouinii]
MAMGPDYYSRFPGFQSNPTASSSDEFTLLARHMGWGKKSKTYKRERASFLASEFATHYGADGTKLQNWQALCLELQIREPIDTITKCRKALSKVHVNLVDLIDARRTGKAPTKFPNSQSLREYTLSKGKIFPKAAAKEEGFLKALLRRIL